MKNINQEGIDAGANMTSLNITNFAKKYKSSYKDYRKETYGEWSILSAVSKKTNSWTAWAKKGEFESNSPLFEQGDVYFEFGKTREQAVLNLKKNDLTL